MYGFSSSFADGRTSSTLLEDLKDPGKERVWHEFVERYRPILIGLGTRCGLQPPDAEDVAQITLTEFSTGYRSGKYDRDRGALRKWLIGIMRSRVIDMHRWKQRGREQSAGDSLDTLPSPAGLDELWDAEERRAIVARAMSLLAAETRTSDQNVEALRLLVCDQLSPTEAATRLGTSVDAIYRAKHRTLSRLRGIVRDLETAHEREVSILPESA